MPGDVVAVPARFDLVTERAGLDRARARRWAVARATDDRLWALGYGFPALADVSAAIADALSER